MKAKGKIILSSIALVLVVTLAIVAVFALTQTSTSSSFKVNFIGTRDVKAYVMAWSSLSNDSATSIEKAKNNDDEYLTFDGAENPLKGENQKALNFEKMVTIPSTDVTADFEFYIANKIDGAGGNELIIEPDVTDLGIENASVTLYYKGNLSSEYQQFTNNYTYVKLTETHQYVMFKCSVKIANGTTSDVTIDNAQLRFNLYSRTSAPDGYESSTAEIIERTTSQIGEYPQTYVGNELNEILKTASDRELIPTGRVFTTNIAGIETACPEYWYNGKKYVKLASAKAYGTSSNESRINFLSGETITDGATYFFKVEPISFVIEEQSGDDYILMTEKVLGSRPPMADVDLYDSEGVLKEGVDLTAITWENCGLRTFLNNTFLNEAGLGTYAKETTIKNYGLYQSHVADFGTGNDTQDKIYLSAQAASLLGTRKQLDGDISDWYMLEITSTMRRYSPSQATDFARATYTMCSAWVDDNYYGDAYYVSRAITANMYLPCFDPTEGSYVSDAFSGNPFFLGFRPIMVVSKSSLGL